MPNQTLWDDPEAITTLLTFNAVSAGAASSLGSEYNNLTSKNRWGLFELVVDWDTTAPTAGGTIDLYLSPSVDDTNFIDTPTPPPDSLFVGWFEPAAVLTSQRLLLKSFADPGSLVLLPPLKLKALVVNNTDQPTTSGSHTVKLRAFNEEIQ